VIADIARDRRDRKNNNLAVIAQIKLIFSDRGKKPLALST